MTGLFGQDLQEIAFDSPNEVVFGQDLQEIAFVCPNAGLIWTGLEGNRLCLSECGAYSDRTCKKLPLIVRMRGLFGQALEGNCLCLSEYGAYSDWAFRKLPTTVPMQGLFGQSFQEIAFDSPNTGLIRTGLAGNCLRHSE